MLLWYASCGLNFLLGGDYREPLCSRVWRQPESRARTIYIDTVDAIMHRLRGDWLHCLHTHADFLVMHRPRPRKEPRAWRNKSPA